MATTPTLTERIMVRRAIDVGAPTKRLRDFADTFGLSPDAVSEAYDRIAEGYEPRPGEVSGLQSKDQAVREETSSRIQEQLLTNLQEYLGQQTETVEAPEGAEKKQEKLFDEKQQLLLKTPQMDTRVLAILDNRVGYAYIRDVLNYYLQIMTHGESQAFEFIVSVFTHLKSLVGETLTGALYGERKMPSQQKMPPQMQVPGEPREPAEQPVLYSPETVFDVMCEAGREKVASQLKEQMKGLFERAMVDMSQRYADVRPRYPEKDLTDIIAACRSEYEKIVPPAIDAYLIQFATGNEQAFLSKIGAIFHGVAMKQFPFDNFIMADDASVETWMADAVDKGAADVAEQFFSSMDKLCAVGVSKNQYYQLADAYIKELAKLNVDQFGAKAHFDMDAWVKVLQSDFAESAENIATSSGYHELATQFQTGLEKTLLDTLEVPIESMAKKTDPKGKGKRMDQTAMVGRVHDYAATRKDEIIREMMGEEQASVIGAAYSVAAQHSQATKTPRQFNQASEFLQKFLERIAATLQEHLDVIASKTTLMALGEYLYDSSRLTLAPGTILPSTALRDSITNISNRLLQGRGASMKQGSVVVIDSDRFVVLAATKEALYLADYDELMVEKRAEIYTCPPDLELTETDEVVSLPLRQCAVDKMVVRASVCGQCPYGMTYGNCTSCMHEPVMKAAVAEDSVTTPVSVIQSAEMDKLLGELQMPEPPATSDETIDVSDQVLKTGTGSVGQVVDVNFNDTYRILWANGTSSVVWGSEIRKMVK